MQLGHSGARASERGPLFNRVALSDEHKAEDGEAWQAISSSAVTPVDGKPLPRAMTQADINEVVQAFVDCDGAHAQGRLRDSRDSRRARLPDPAVPVAGDQQAQRRLWRRPEGAHALCAGDHRSGARGVAGRQAAVLPRLQRRRQGRAVDAARHGGAVEGIEGARRRPDRLLVRRADRQFVAAVGAAHSRPSRALCGAREAGDRHADHGAGPDHRAAAGGRAAAAGRHRPDRDGARTDVLVRLAGACGARARRAELSRTVPAGVHPPPEAARRARRHAGEPHGDLACRWI